MPPRLLPKPQAKKLTQGSDNDVVDDLEEEINTPTPKNSRSFEFVNATGATLPNATSQPFIRSHVMREANRLTYSPSTGQNVGSSSGGDPQMQEASVQKFRISSSGLRPLLPSKRSRRGQARLAVPSSSRTIEKGVEGGSQTEMQHRRGMDASDLHDNTGAAAQFASDPGLQALGRFISEDSPSNVVRSLARCTSTDRLPSVSSGSPVPLTATLFSIGGDQMDPFNSLPIPNSPRIELLLHHYQARFIESAPLMMAVRKLWFGSAILDPAFLFIKLCHAAASLSLIERSGDLVESLMLKNESIKIINERLDQSPTNISKGTLSAVACIACYESVHGTLESVQIHKDGLQQMVEIRGGMRNDNSCPGLRRLVAWADINTSTALSSAPVFPSVKVLLEEMPLSDETPYPSDSLGFHILSPSWHQDSLQDPFYTQYLDGFVIEQLTRLRRLTSYLGPNAETHSLNLWFSDAIYSVQREFMLASERLHGTPGLDQPCCIAGLIYVACFLRHVNPNIKIMENLNARLQVSMQEVVKDLGKDPMESISHLLLWILIIGAVSSKQVDWYVQELVLLARSISMPDWEGVQGILTDIAFPEIAFLTAKGVWEQVESQWRRREEERTEM